MNKLDQDYQQLLLDIMTNGVEKEDRTGTGTISVFGRQIRHNMQDGFPLLTTKRMAINSIMTELKWFLKGDTNIKYLVENGCNIWNGDAYKQYVDIECNPPHDHSLSQKEFIDRIKTDNLFAAKWGELGPIYGQQWRHWTVSEDTSYDDEYVWVDQIQYLIQQLKENPDSRRLMVSAWNVGELDQMTLPPCHYGFQVYTRPSTREEKIVNPGKYRVVSLMWNQRSVDTFLGLPFNIASYGMLLELIAKECDMIPGELIGNLGDVHLYKNHIKQANTQCSRQSYNLPKLTKLKGSLLKGEFEHSIEYYECWPKIEAPISN
jgi:thymidylate synthase